MIGSSNEACMAFVLEDFFINIPENSKNKICVQAIMVMAIPFKLIRQLKAAWSDFLAITISNSFSYKPISLKIYRLSPIGTSRFGFLSTFKY